VTNHSSFAILLIFFSTSCGFFTAKQETEPTERQDPPAQVVESPVVETKSVALAQSSSAKPQAKGPTKTAIQSLSRNEIRRVQAALKENNFDPGPVDGILGPRTEGALRQLQLGCSKLQDVAEISAVGTSWPDREADSKSLSERINLTLNNEEVQKIQVQLKQAGFNPGPVDGKLGPRTKSALLRARSACSLANQFRTIEPENFSFTTAESPEVATISSKPPKDARASVAYRSSNVLDSGSSSLIHTAEKISGANEIKLVQIRLREAGFDPGPIDGIMGPRTRSALQRYRASNGAKMTSARMLGIGSAKEY